MKKKKTDPEMVIKNGYIFSKRNGFKFSKGLKAELKKNLNDWYNGLRAVK